MGWPKGKRRKVIPDYILNRPNRKTSDWLVDPPADSCRSYELAVNEEARNSFVESGEYLEADSALSVRARVAYDGNHRAAKALKDKTQALNRNRMQEAEARRQWIASNCHKELFLPSRKQAIALIQQALGVAKRQVPSDKTLYKDISLIRAGCGTT